MTDKRLQVIYLTFVGIELLLGMLKYCLEKKSLKVILFL